MRVAKTAITSYDVAIFRQSKNVAGAIAPPPPMSRRSTSFEVDDSIRMLERKALQQHAVDDAEHRGVRADADGQRKDDDRGEDWGLEQHPYGVPQIANESVHVCPDK